MQNLQNAKQIDRLCSFWPHPAVEPSTMAAYGEAVANAHPDDVRRAVDDFIFRRVDRNHEFIPVPGALSNQIIKARNARLDEEARNRPRLAPPPPAKLGIPATDRGDLIERLKRENGGYLIKAMSINERLEVAKHRAAVEKTILAAFDGDESALAEYRAQNEAMGIARKSEAVAA